jgi:hypothetical protein
MFWVEYRQLAHSSIRRGIRLALPALILPSLTAGAPDLGSLRDAFARGDYQQAKAIVDAYSRSGEAYPLTDSIFISRYGAVLYSLDPNTVDRARYYMLQSLTWVPRDDFADLHPTSETRFILEKIRSEFIDTTSTDTAPKQAGEKAKGPERHAIMSRRVLWIGGGGLALVAGGWYWISLQSSGNPERKPVRIDVEASR